MKMVKSLILGSAAGLLAMSGTQAADLPVKAKPVEYVRICSLYGAGFFYIPGTDTCLKLGGYLRVDTTFNGSIYDQPAWSGDLGQGNRYRDYFAARSRMALTVDTRTATEYGVVRTFGQADFQFTTQGNNTVNPNAFTGAAATGTSTSLLNQPGEGYVAVEYVFLQFAGFTFGKSSSAYATPWNGYPGNNSSFLVGGYDSVTGVNNIQYTWQFGNGVSATLGIDDSSASNFNRTQIINAIGGAAVAPSTAPGGGAGSAAGNQGGAIGFSGGCTALYTPTGCAYGGTSVPDFVGNIRVDQAWGLFQISGAVHDNRGGYFQGSNLISTAVTPAGFSQTGFINFGHPSDVYGGAVMAALQIKNIPTGPGDDIKLDASWATGASHYTLGTSAADPSSFNIYSGTRFAMGVVTDAIYSGNSPVGCNPTGVAGGLGCNGNT